jgi:polyhydroxyalkanoate synthesis regulator phasin
METKDKTVEDLFRDLGKKIDQLIERGKMNSEEIRVELDKRVEEIRRNKEKLEEDFKNFTGDKEKWKAVESSLENAAKELKRAVETAFGKKNA